MPLRLHRSAASDATAPARVGPATVLVAEQRRAFTWWVVAGLAVIVAAGGILVHGRANPLGIEVHIVDAVDRHGGGSAFWEPVFSSAIPATIIVVSVALLVWSLTRRWWRAVAACLAVPLALLVAEEVFKPLVDRRDPGSGLLYPSGHLTGLGAAATLTLILVAPRLRRPGASIGLGIACAAVCVAGVLAAVASHAHGPIDAVAGLPTGIGLTLAWVLTVDAAADASVARASSRAAPRP